MRISIVVPAYNEEQLLPKSLAAIRRELDRFPCDAEVIVVNNASTDRTGEIARAHDWVCAVDEPKKGLVRARQTGFAASTGEIIANIDADTLMPEGWLRTVLTEFERDSGLAALSGPFIYHDLFVAHRVITRLWYLAAYLSHLVNHYVLRSGAMLQGGNFILRRTHLEQIGGFDTSIEFYGEDTDIARRISCVGKVKWTFRLPMYASGRRLKHEGIVVTGLRYAANYFYTLVRGKPLTVAYTDVREE